MRNLLSLFICVFLSASAYSQFRNPTFRLAINCPIIPDAKNTATDPGNYWPGRYRENFAPKPGVEFNFNIDVYTHSKFFINTGLTFQGYYYNRTIYYSDPGSTNEIVSSDHAIGDNTLIFFQIPITVGRKFLSDKLRVQVGLAPAFLLGSTRYRRKFNVISYNIYDIYYVDKDTSGDSFTHTVVNGLCEASYLITKRFSLNLNYQRSFNPIYVKENRYGGKAFLNSLAFGVSFNCGKL